ncbi:MAG: PAS domain S-box protein, partial [Anaerolineae bacterium]|nr:PAS domain S-box protein [Anaerolineae bacterium]
MDKLPLPIKIVLLAGIYALSALIGLQFADTQSSVTLIWPPTGIALAGLLILGRESWPGIVLGTVITALLTPGQTPMAWPLIVVLAVSNALEAVVSLFLLRRLQFQSNLSRIRDIFLLGVVATTVGALIGATFGVTSLFELSPVPISGSYIESWLQWWLGDSMGVLVFTPLLLAWYHRPDGYVPPRRVPGRILLVLIPALVAALVFLIPPPMPNFPLGHAIFPFILWLALNLQLREVTLAGLLVSGVAAWETAQGEGPFSRPDMHENMLYLWTFIMTTNVTAVVMAVIVREWRESSLTMRRERDFMMQITNTLGQGVTVTNEDGRFIFANPAFSTMLGYDSPERVVGETIRNMTISADIEILEHARELRFLGQTNTYEVRLMHTDGHLVHTRITGAPRWQDGRVIGTIAVFTDITEQQRMEGALRESEQRFRSVFESCPIGIATADKTGLVTSINQAYVDLIALANGKVEDLGEFNLLNADTFQNAGIQEYFTRLYQEHTPFSVEAEVEGHLRRRIRRYQGVPLPDAAGNIAGAVVMTEDITERKQSEEKIRDREQRLRTIFDNAPVGILVGDANGILTDINDTYMNILGGSPEQRSQIIGRIGLHNIDTFKNAGIHEYFERLLEHGESFSTDAFIVSMFGRERNLHYQGTPLFDSEGRVSGLILVTEDITPRKEIENQLRQANAEISSSRD